MRNNKLDLDPYKCAKKKLYIKSIIWYRVSNWDGWEWWWESQFNWDGDV